MHSLVQVFLWTFVIVCPSKCWDDGPLDREMLEFSKEIRPLYKTPSLVCESPICPTFLSTLVIALWILVVLVNVW